LSLAQQSLFLSPGFRTAVYADLEVATKSGNEDQPQQVSEELAKRIRRSKFSDQLGAKIGF
jgi:hypothetical protein